MHGVRVGTAGASVFDPGTPGFERPFAHSSAFVLPLCVIVTESRITRPCPATFASKNPLPGRPPPHPSRGNNAMQGRSRCDVSPPPSARPGMQLHRPAPTPWRPLPPCPNSNALTRGRCACLRWPAAGNARDNRRGMRREGGGAVPNVTHACPSRQQQQQPCTAVPKAAGRVRPPVRQPASVLRPPPPSPTHPPPRPTCAPHPRRAQLLLHSLLTRPHTCCAGLHAPMPAHKQVLIHTLARGSCAALPDAPLLPPVLPNSQDLHTYCPALRLPPFRAGQHGHGTGGPSQLADTGLLRPLPGSALTPSPLSPLIGGSRLPALATAAVLAAQSLALLGLALVAVALLALLLVEPGKPGSRAGGDGDGEAVSRQRASSVRAAVTQMGRAAQCSAGPGLPLSHACAAGTVALAQRSLPRQAAAGAQAGCSTARGRPAHTHVERQASCDASFLSYSAWRRPLCSRRLRALSLRMALSCCSSV